MPKLALTIFSSSNSDSIENFEALDYFNFIFYFSNRFRPRSYFRLVPGNVYLFGSNLVLITFGRMIKSSLIPILGTNKST